MVDRRTREYGIVREKMVPIPVPVASSRRDAKESSFGLIFREESYNDGQGGMKGRTNIGARIPNAKGQLGIGRMDIEEGEHGHNHGGNKEPFR